MKAGRKDSSPEFIILSNAGFIGGVIEWTNDCVVKSACDLSKYISSNYLIFDLTTTYPEMVQVMNKNMVEYILVSRKHGSTKAVSIKGVIGKREILESVNEVTSYLI